MPTSRSNPFRTPPVNFDYEPVIETMAQCREEVERLKREYGERLPMRREAEAVLHDIDALAKLLPDGAANRISPHRQWHSTR